MTVWENSTFQRDSPEQTNLDPPKLHPRITVRHSISLNLNSALDPYLQHHQST